MTGIRQFLQNALAMTRKPGASTTLDVPPTQLFTELLLRLIALVAALNWNFVAIALNSAELALVRAHSASNCTVAWRN
jgi:hypothetical protein